MSDARSSHLTTFKDAPMKRDESNRDATAKDPNNVILTPITFFNIIVLFSASQLRIGGDTPPMQSASVFQIRAAPNRCFSSKFNADILSAAKIYMIYCDFLLGIVLGILIRIEHISEYEYFFRQPTQKKVNIIDTFLQLFSLNC